MEYKKEMILLAIIILFACLWRFYNYSERWTLHQDQGRDGVIALHAIETKQLPLLGPPSSAGDFSFGPLYYWIIILFTLLIPSVNGPWIGFTLLSIFSIAVYFYLGKKIGGLVFATILGLISAFASASVYHAPDLLNPMLLNFFVPLAFLMMVYSLEKDKLIYPLILGFAAGAAINAHLQALGLIVLLGLTIIFKTAKRVKLTLGIMIGLLISFAPLIYFDLKNNFSWSKSIIEYITVGQNKFNLSYSWISDLKDFWPKLWGEVLTYFPNAGYPIIGLFILVFVFSIKEKKFSKSFWIIFLTFISQVIILKFYKGPRMPVYLLLEHPFIIFLTSFTLWRIWGVKKVLGILGILIVLSLSSYSNLKIINESSKTPSILLLKQKIDEVIPGQKSIYGFSQSNGVALPLQYLYLKEGKIDAASVKLGICESTIERNPITLESTVNCPDNGGQIVSIGNYRVFNLDGKDTGGLEHFTSEKIYNWISKRYD